MITAVANSKAWLFCMLNTFLLSYVEFNVKLALFFFFFSYCRCIVIE